jgi:hypothetical protein
MKASSKVIAFLLFFFGLLLVGGALAGEAGTVSCSTPGCGYHTNLKIGGGKKLPAITGYCSKEKKFVRLKLESWDDYHKPQRCPGSRERLQPIYEGSDISRIPCPKCGHKTLEYQRVLFFD